MLERILIDIQSKASRPMVINIRQAIEMVTDAWWNVRHEVIKICWRKAGFVKVEPLQEGHQDLACNEAESLQKTDVGKVHGEF